MPADAQSHDKSPAETLSGKFLDMQQRNATFLARANEIVSEAARGIWASEMDLMRLESARASRLFQPAGDWTKPPSAADFSSQWHETSDKVIAHMREISDLARKCCWDLCDLYAQSIPTEQKPGS